MSDFVEALLQRKDCGAYAGQGNVTTSISLGNESKMLSLHTSLTRKPYLVKLTRPWILQVPTLRSVTEQACCQAPQSPWQSSTSHHRKPHHEGTPDT